MSKLSTLEHAFYTGNYTSVVGTDISDLTGHEADRSRQLQLRAQIAQGKGREVAAVLRGADDAVSQALATYAEYVQGDTKAIENAAKLGSGPVETHMHALILACETQYSEALQLLSHVDKSLDCMLLQVHILLVQNQISRAREIVDSARSWSNDHIVFNLAEAWVSLSTLDDLDAAQKAFYIFEENNSLGPSPRSALGEAVAQLELRRFPEAAESLKPALASGTEDALATATALAAILGQEPPSAAVTADLQAKDQLFDRVAAKYTKA